MTLDARYASCTESKPESAGPGPADTAGLLAFIRNDLCITPGVDQQIGGLTMWVPGCLIYLTASMITLAQWYAAPEEGSPAVGREAVQQ